MNELMAEIKARKSIRKYKPDPVSDEDIMLLVEAARLAASGNNKQPWRFIVIRDEEKKQKITAADHDQDWMLTAPVFIACLADLRSRVDNPPDEELLEESSSWELKRIIRDSAIAVTHMMLQAEHMGLATCWTGWYSQHEMRQILGVDNCVWITGILTVGYSNTTPKERPRLTAEEIVRFE